LLLVQAFEDAGHAVWRVVIEGKRVEVFLGQKDGSVMSGKNEFDLVEMKK